MLQLPLSDNTDRNVGKGPSLFQHFKDEIKQQLNIKDKTNNKRI